MTRQAEVTAKGCGDGFDGLQQRGLDSLDLSIVGTSTLTTAPPGPLPLSVVRSMPCSAASRRALGEAGIIRMADRLVGLLHLRVGEHV